MVTPDDIAVELGRPLLDPGTLAIEQWEQWIADARMLIEARLGDLAALNQDRLDYVVRQAVAAHIRHPDDATQVAVSVDDGSVSRSYRSGRGRITILDEWWDLLSPKSNSGAFSIVPAGSGTCHADVCSANTYVDGNGAIMFGGAYCSCGAEVAGYPLYEAEA
ncbi:MAG: hypothetical protein QM714_00255 [Nocardioides sp.]|uniref:hypothetical protein n=1 Tax=Nocardioides sp. TaxID=35761 RepID=UPI0039E3201F